APQPDVRHADRPRGHPRARLGARRHRRLHRGGRRLPRAVQDRGADGPGAAARRDPRLRHAADRPGHAAAARVPRHLAFHHRDPPPGERRRPGDPRGDGRAVRPRDRPDDGHPLEGHLRAARSRHRRDREDREHPGEHRHQERVAEMDGDLLFGLVVVTALAFDFTNGFHDTANVVATSISTRALPPRVAVGFAAVLNFVGAFLSLAVAATVAGGIVDAAAITLPVVFAGLIGAIVSGGLLALAHGTNDAQKTMGVIALAMVAHGNLPAADPHPPTWVVVSAASAIAAGTYSGGWRIIRTMGTRIIKMDPAQGFT